MTDERGWGRTAWNLTGTLAVKAGLLEIQSKHLGLKQSAGSRELGPRAGDVAVGAKGRDWDQDA